MRGYDERARKAMEVVRAIRDSDPSISPSLLARIDNLRNELDSLRPLSPEDLLKLTQAMKAEYTYHTISLEGNTLTLRETTLVLEHGITVEGKTLREHLEAVNIPRALEYLLKLLGRELRVSDLLNLHSIVMRGIDEAEPGKFRTGLVAIAGSTYLPPPAYEVPFLVEELVEYVNANSAKLHPVGLAFKAHLWLVAIHPFRDGNGRVARLLTGLLLVRNGYPPLIVRREHRRRYISTIERALRGEFRPYYDFMASELIGTVVRFLAFLNEDEESELVELAETSRGLGLDPEYMGLLARRGLLPAVKLGGRWYVRRKDLMEYVRRKLRKARDTN